jgi:hypothetical protein
MASVSGILVRPAARRPQEGGGRGARREARMIPNGYTLVVDADGCRHRRYARWAEVPPAARLPEHLCPLRWNLEEHCAVAVPDKPRGRNPGFRPCGMKHSPGSDLCSIHARKERHPSQQHAPGASE